MSRGTSSAGATRISVGIGSWADAEYTGVLYPKGVPAADRLKIYATHFDHVEVNSSYYRTPRRATVAQWVKQTPRHFMFDVKLHRAFSDAPEKTAREGDFVAWWLENTQPLIAAKKLGAFLLVMPPRFEPEKRRLDELDALVEKLAPHPLAVELRHAGWVEGEARGQTLRFFRDRKLVWVAVDMPRVKGSTIMPPIDEVTNPRLAYVRLHGRRDDWLKAKSAEERHTYEYSAVELKEIAGRVRTLAAQAKTVHVVANNHAQDFAPKAALALQELLRKVRRVATPKPVRRGRG